METAVAAIPKEKAISLIDEPNYKIELVSTNEVTNAVLETFETITKGSLPSNKQLIAALETGKEVLQEKAKEVTPKKAKRILEDVKNFIQDMEMFIEEKNKGDKFQNLLTKGKELFEKMPDMGSEAKHLTEELKPLKENATLMLESLTRLTYQIVSSRECRQILIEGISILEEVFKNVTEKAEAGVKKTRKRKAAAPAKGTRASKGKKGKKEDTVEAIKGEAKSVTELLKQDIARGDISLGRTKEEIAELTQKVFTELQSGEVLSDVHLNVLTTRLRHLLIKLTESYDFKRTLKELVNIFDQTRRIVNDIAETSEAAILKNQPAQELWKEGKELIEGFTGRKSVDPLIKHIMSLTTVVKDNKALKEWFTELKTFVMEVIENPDVLKDDARWKLGKELITKAQEVMETEFMDELNELFGEMKDILTTMTTDFSTLRVASDIAKLGKDIWVDASGQVSFLALQQSLQQLKGLLVPVLSKLVTNLPLPKIQGSTDSYTWWIDNVVFDGTALIPDRLHTKLEAETEVKVKELSPDEINAVLYMDIKDIDWIFKNVNFYFNRTVMPQYEDHGVLDASIKGMQLNTKWTINTMGSGPTRISIDEVTCRIAEVNVNVIAAKHDIIDTVASALFATSVKTRIESVIENNVKSGLLSVAKYLGGSLESAPESMTIETSF